MFTHEIDCMSPAFQLRLHANQINFETECRCENAEIPKNNRTNVMSKHF